MTISMVSYYAVRTGVPWRKSQKFNTRPKRAYNRRQKSVEVYEEKVKTIKKSNIIDQILSSDLDKKAKLAILEHLL